MRLHLLAGNLLRGVGTARYVRRFSSPIVGAAAGLESSRACFGAGCFWGTEKFFKVDFPQIYGDNDGDNSLTDLRVGYMGPSTAMVNPTYRDVCSGTSQHVEVCSFRYGGGDDMYAQLCRHFFSFHDPTTENRQGMDVGSQYASVIFYHGAAQRQVAETVKAEFQSLLDRKQVRYSGGTVLTAILPATTFYEAEEEHQNYLLRNPGGYCNHFYRLTPPVRSPAQQK